MLKNETAQTQIYQSTKQNDVKVSLYIDLRLFYGFFCLSPTNTTGVEPTELLQTVGWA
ncbi:MAG: hypothetical protein HWQ38_33975 [Nostoc sp. NMS7]|uniref:hypothetical protein n=1 Tax=Nostoc sp. NMS7 TaxID=2815391 RepID=UPI002600B945|nr:hypothetical protein [Nostoc sp. NMS7]MBN3951211.1 hypothetical protein [Nostoc sp. NMS7]